MRSIARNVLPVLVGPRTAVTPAPRARGSRAEWDDREIGIKIPEAKFRQSDDDATDRFEVLDGPPAIGTCLAQGSGERNQAARNRSCLSLNFSDDTTAYLHLHKISSTTCAIGAVASITIPPCGVSSFVACNRTISSRSLGLPPNSSSGLPVSRWFNVWRSTSRTNTPSNKPIKRGKFLEPPQKKEIAWR